MSINSGLTKLRFHILSTSFDDENSFHTIALKYYNKNENKNISISSQVKTLKSKLYKKLNENYQLTEVTERSVINGCSDPFR